MSFLCHSIQWQNEASSHCALSQSSIPGHKLNLQPFAVSPFCVLNQYVFNLKWILLLISPWKIPQDNVEASFVFCSSHFSYSPPTSTGKKPLTNFITALKSKESHKETKITFFFSNNKKHDSSLGLSPPLQAALMEDQLAWMQLASEEIFRHRSYTNTNVYMFEP